MHENRDEPKVLHVDTEHTWRGGEQQMLYLARGLAQRGLRTATVCQPGSPAAGRCRREGIKAYRLRMRGELDLPAALGLARIAKQGNFNILHSHTSHAHSLVQLASHLFMARLRVVAHRRIAFPVGRALGGLGKLKYTRGVDAYIAISGRVKETLVEAGVRPEKVFVINSAANPKRFLHTPSRPSLRAELGIPGDAFVVGNVGYLVEHKDHINLLMATSRVREKVPQLWVVIVGKGPLKGHIERRAGKLKMKDRLVMTGFRTDIPRLLRTFDLFALSSSQEGMASCLAEAMLSGCPVVATNAGGVEDVVVDGQTGLLVPIKNPVALSDAILRLIRDRELARRMAARAKKRALRKFTPSHLTRETLSVYSRLLSSAP